MKVRSLWAVATGTVRRLLGSLRQLFEFLVRWQIRVVVALLRVRLRAESRFSSWRPKGQPRVLATACGPFPIYSQTFVYQEVYALAERGFNVRFSYSALEDRSGLGPRYARLWRVKRRLLLTSRLRHDDYRFYQKRMPAKVEALTRAICEASGLSRATVLEHDHFLQAFSFARMAAAWRPDYLHSYFFYEQTLFSLVAASLLDIPRGVTCYADHMLDDYPLKLVALNVTTCDVVVATSRRIKAELEAIAGGVSRPNVLVKPNAIDTRVFESAPRDRAQTGLRPYLVSVCRVEPKKGLSYLVEAVSLLRKAGVDVELHHVGAPDAHMPARRACAKELEAQVARLGLGSAVYFEGRRTGEEVRQFLARADVFVAPFVELENGDKDGISTAVLEAMAAQCAIVATDAGSTTEAIDSGENGLIVAQRNAEQLASAIRTILSDPELATRLGRSARDKAVREFDVAHCEERFHERIRHAIARRAS